MVWLRACTKGVSPVVVFNEATVDHARYIKEMLPVALKFGEKVFGNDGVFQQDDAKPRPHPHPQTQSTVQNISSSLISKVFCWPIQRTRQTFGTHWFCHDFAQIPIVRTAKDLNISMKNTLIPEKYSGCTVSLLLITSLVQCRKSWNVDSSGLRK